MPRAGLTPSTVVREAARLADEVGYERLTLAALAGRLGVALPSLYKHVKGADALSQKLAALAVDELADAMTSAAAGRAGVDGLRAVATAWRDYARRHPGRYPAAQRVPDPADPEHVAAGRRALDTIYAILRGYGLTGDAAVDAARLFRSAVHGFITLEAAGGFGLPRGIDRSFDQLVAALDTAYRDWRA
ncbi:TetR family transcriptional regulator [Micromonospora palomenae]|uniref:TetR family transcriptional regulator n=1 Tax=Micromonospora palomenae TaxID=1461247 RepID=A0A561WH28_9ACTN|nr:TetR/AcrR family transcriptional regulator [Micromonospora palomenae]TWG23177.1 TetR family transcriptional regulator [Micromonospora palomenae]